MSNISLIMNLLKIFGFNFIILLIFGTIFVKSNCPNINPPRGGFTAVSCVGVSHGFECQFSCKTGCVGPTLQSLRCVNNKWDQRIPGPNETCRPPECSARSIINGATCGPTRAGEKCSYSCNQGYRLSGQQTFECIFQDMTRDCVSEWESAPLPSCIGEGCPQLFATNNLIFKDSNQCTNPLPGSKCEFSCPSGYTLSPNINYLECNTSGQWSEQLPNCIKRKDICTNVEIPTYAKTSGDCVTTSHNTVNLNSVCTIICWDNCLFSNGSDLLELRCLGQDINGGWDQPLPTTCERPRYCDPINIPFANSCPLTYVGQTCSVTCEQGYRKSGSNVLTCVESPQAVNQSAIGGSTCNKPFWSPSPSSQPICVSSQRSHSCPDIRPPNGTQVQGICLNAAVNDECMWSCEPGYMNPINNGNKMTVRCQSNGEWDGPTQCVQTLTCPSLPRLGNGSYTDSTCSPGIPGESCFFSCNDNFALDPSNLTSVLCKKNGKWSNGGVVPLCVPSIEGDCKNVAIPQFAKMIGHCVSTPDKRIALDSVCTIVCFDGCFLEHRTDPELREGSLELTCAKLNGGTGWDKPIPDTCLQETQCLQIGPIEFGSSCPTANVGESCTITCNEGYNLVGNDVFTCILPTSINPDVCTLPRWSFSPNTTLPSCQRFGCQDVVIPKGVRTSGKCIDAMVGQQCTVICPDNTENKIVCQSDRQWSGVPECVSIRCSDLYERQIKNGGVTEDDNCKSRSVGAECRYFCDENFVLNGREKVVCQSNGQWDPDTTPTCDPIKTIINCDALPDIENGSQDGDCAPGVSGSVCTYKCNHGFILNGDPLFLCQKDKSWDKRDLPNCSPNTRQAVLCPDINGLENGVTEGICTQAVALNKCSFQCNDGYQLDGPQEITCGADGNWDAESPQCSEVGATGEPVTDEPTTSEPETGERTTSEPVSGEPTTSEQVTGEPTTSEQVTGEPTTSEQVTGEPTTKEPVTRETTTREPKTKEPVTGEPKTCPSLNFTPNINMQGMCNPGQPEKQCTLVCAKVPSRELTVTCQRDGTWSASINSLNCTSRTPGVCPPPPLPTGAKYVNYCSPGRVGRRCEMQCRKGFGLETKNSLLCTMNGTWIGSPPKCLRQCRAIPAANGRLTGQCKPTGLENKSCSLRCNYGFQLNGPRSVICGTNGLWQPTLPRCLRQTSNCG